jgi:hypothetical protein
MQHAFMRLFSRSLVPHSRRLLSYTRTLNGGEFEWEDPKSKDDIVNINYIQRDGTLRKIQGKVGDNVMYLAHRLVAFYTKNSDNFVDFRYDIEIEGACEASLACCTCHVYVDDAFYDKIPAPTEDEEDM